MIRTEKMVKTKKYIIRRVSLETGYNQKVVAKIINTLLNDIADEVSKGNKVRFNNFGIFTQKIRKARVARNPYTNQQLSIPEKVTPVFIPGSGLKMRVSAQHKTTN